MVADVSDQDFCNATPRALFDGLEQFAWDVSRTGDFFVTVESRSEVYRAKDTKLDRDVALKVLPHAFTDDPDRLARFEREAKVLASLNHPNIGHIYGLEEAEGQKALVLELVEGPTLVRHTRCGAQGRG